MLIGDTGYHFHFVNIQPIARSLNGSNKIIAKFPEMVKSTS
jgi:hypothetical protein